MEGGRLGTKARGMWKGVVLKKAVGGGCFPVAALGKRCICFGYSCVIAWDIRFLVMCVFLSLLLLLEHPDWDKVEGRSEGI